MTHINNVVWNTLTSPQRWIEPWYIVYAL